ncbi:MAG TPA: hypothetical protein VFE96_09655 [Candidatus Bathyarchaeia archaeon]|nr:hypothetical protein [Candidatus Bathyarchaeia archaeon]
MPRDPLRIPFKHTLAFIGTAAFLLSFFGSRLFATTCPTCVVVGSGIHFHHFWYGIEMLAIVGWLSIAGVRTERLDRAYALVYGLGLGLIGDEVGLLLTFGNYYSELTYEIFVGAVGLILLGTIAVRFGERLRRDLIGLGPWEALFLTGLFLAGFSTLFFAFDQTLIGVPMALAGAIAIIFGYRGRRETAAMEKATLTEVHYEP